MRRRAAIRYAHRKRSLDIEADRYVRLFQTLVGGSAICGS